MVYDTTAAGKMLPVPLSQQSFRRVIYGFIPTYDTYRCRNLLPRTRLNRSTCIQAALDSQAAFAVSQQAAAFAAVVGAEAAFTGLTTDTNKQGRPGIVPTIGGVAGIVAVRLVVFF